MDTRATDCFPGQLRSGNRCPGGVVKDESASDGAYVAGARTGHNALGTVFELLSVVWKRCPGT
jgi:hypothetical protein